MLDASARLIRLLSLLQAQRFWQGPELALRLDVTERTVRRDMEKLRTLGYPVQATAGVAGGYRLAAGKRLPPLQLDDNEALAVVFGLRSAAVGTIAGMETAALHALDKVSQLLPERLQRRVAGLRDSVDATPFCASPVDPDVLTTLTQAAQEQWRLEFDYLDAKGQASHRDVEPHGVVHAQSRWYLVCWDRVRQDWRTFRVDRLRNPDCVQERTPRKPLPSASLGAFVAQSLAQHARPLRARIELHASFAATQERFPWLAPHLTPLSKDRCLLETNALALDRLAYYVSTLGADFVVHEPKELIDHLAGLAQRLNRAVQTSSAT